MKFFGKILDVITFKKKRERIKKRKDDLLDRKRKAERMEKEQEEIALHIQGVIDNIISDWNSSMYTDKIILNNDEWMYKMEDGTKVIYIPRSKSKNDKDTVVIHEKARIVTYSMGMLHGVKFLVVYGKILEVIEKGGARKRNNVENKNHKRYNVLEENVKLRKENLLKMSANDPNRSGLEAELKIAERMLDNMRKKNK